MPQVHIVRIPTSRFEGVAGKNAAVECEEWLNTNVGEIRKEWLVAFSERRQQWEFTFFNGEHAMLFKLIWS